MTIKDENGNTICLGDTLDSKDGYSVKVVTDGKELVGKLLCLPGHSCENIPYDLNNGVGYTKRSGKVEELGEAARYCREHRSPKE